MKKHGCLWWGFIGWWWRPITLPFRLLVALIRCGRKYAAGTEERVQRIQALDDAQSEKLAEKRKELEAKKTELLGKQETHKVAGVSFRQDALKALGTKNPDFTKTKKQLETEGLVEERIHEYIFAPKKVELIPEPDNPYSENGNATKVVVDGQHIGYIKSGSSAHVSNLIKENRIQQVECFIGGGKSKVLTWDDDAERYTLESDEIGIYARLTVTVKP